MATSVAECDAMIAAAEKGGVKLGVDYRLHYEPHHVHAIELVRGGAVGGPTAGNYEFSWGYTRALTKSPKPIKRWLLDKELAGGGALFDTGVYPIQAACYLTGAEPTTVTGVASTVRRDLYSAGVEETMTYTLGFEDGFVASCRASYGAKLQQCLTAGPDGFVDVVGDAGGRPFNQSGGGRPNGKAIRLERSRVKKEDTLQLARLHDAFALSILGDHEFRCPGSMGRRDIAICEAVMKSASEGGRSVTI